MNFKSKFNISDKVWISNYNLPTLITIGKIIIEHTDSSGRPGEKLFTNYKPQKKYRETYMCIETGIGSGAVYELNESLFKTYEECSKAIQAKEK